MDLRAELGAAIDEAHRHGVKVTAHLCSVGYREAVALGIDNLEHGLFANSEYDPDKRPDECPPGFRNGYADPRRERPGGPGDLPRHDRERGRDDVDTRRLRDLGLRPPADRPSACTTSWPRRSPRRFDESPSRAGQAGERSIRLSSPRPCSTSAPSWTLGGCWRPEWTPPGYGAAPPGLGDQRNFELLLEAGFSTPEVVQIMSANGAKVLGIDGDVGTVEAARSPTSSSSTPTSKRWATCTTRRSSSATAWVGMPRNWWTPFGAWWGSADATPTATGLYSPDLRNGFTLRPARLSVRSARKRRSRVSSRLADMTQWVTCFR